MKRDRPGFRAVFFPLSDYYGTEYLEHFVNEVLYFKESEHVVAALRAASVSKKRRYNLAAFQSVDIPFSAASLQIRAFMRPEMVY